jgi:hypothetical protein
MKVRLALTGLAATTVLVAGAVAPGAVAAASVTTTASSSREWSQTMQNGKLDQWCLNGDKNGQGILQITSLAGNDCELFWDLTATNGSFSFREFYSGKCLDGSAASGVRLYTCSTASYNNGYQKWVEYTYDADGSNVDWKNVATGKCLDWSWTEGLRLYTCSTASFNNGYQHWNYEG